MSRNGAPIRIKSILITAGPTREKIDPVRFISNYSTGTFGYEIAKAARRKGMKTTLISGPVPLKAPEGVRVIRVESALEMKSAVTENIETADCLVMAAAASDWRPRFPSEKKLKRGGGKTSLELVENPDILRGISGRKDKIIVGFALETEALEKNALKKLKSKGMDMIVANKLTKDSQVFGDGVKDILIMDRFGRKKTFSRLPKAALAKIILDKILSFNI